jgi:hypothetical protein
LALMGHPPNRAVAALERGQRITVRVPIAPAEGKTEFSLRAAGIAGEPATVTLSAGGDATTSAEIDQPKTLSLGFDGKSASPPGELVLEIAATRGPASLGLRNLMLTRDGKPIALDIALQRRDYPEKGPVASSPAIHPAIEQALVEWDWRMQDGIATPRRPHTFAEAVEKTLARGDRLLADLRDSGVPLADEATAWAALRGRYEALESDAAATGDAWESLWLDVHRLRRRIVLANPKFDLGPLLFAKRVPSTMAHQLTQYYGYLARPGGGLFVLEEPGRSMRVRQLGGSLPNGSVIRPDVSYDGATIYFGFCPCDTGPEVWRDPKCMDRRYHLYSMRADGADPKQLTDGPYDDFSPIETPSGKLLFCSTRRGGYHRCGGGPCYVYALASAEADGSNPHPISFHETNEWDPAILGDGRVVYTRWDYVDRNAVFYQQLWSVRQDGSDVRIFYGNNTFNPVGTWETRPVPGSTKVMATAAPHHGMTAGSIVLVDVARGVDGPGPITRLTPDAVFPEAENGLFFGKPLPGPTRFDDEPAQTWGPQPQSQATRLKNVPEEEERWPGHCYRSPYPLSETYFLAAYSFDRLRGEPGPNLPNMFGLYAVDAFGNKELLYRDPNLSSQWPMPLRARPRPPVLAMPSRWAESTDAHPEGTFFVKNVHDSWPKLPDVEITRLRVVQVLPKTTPNANQPMVGAASASPGKQVLGTVPVEKDGSAYFRVPARLPVLFQALDARGRAVQTMRSLTYLQPGEQVSCIGCHEPRTTSGGTPGTALALERPPSTLAPGPDGSRPLSYPILVQPVLDRQCAQCHNPDKPEGKIVLTGVADGAFSKSYNALVPYVSYTAWGLPEENHEPLTMPDRFGARASRLVALLDKGHHDVSLSPEDWDRIVTWIDANALFYGTFKPEDQARQLRGERIAGPELE